MIARKGIFAVVFGFGFSDWIINLTGDISLNHRFPSLMGF